MVSSETDASPSDTLFIRASQMHWAYKDAIKRQNVASLPPIRRSVTLLEGNPEMLFGAFFFATVLFSAIHGDAAESRKRNRYPTAPSFDCKNHGALAENIPVSYCNNPK